VKVAKTEYVILCTTALKNTKQLQQQQQQQQLEVHANVAKINTKIS